MLHAVHCRQTCFTLITSSTQTPEFSVNSNIISRLRGLSWGWHRFFVINEFSEEIIHHVLFKHSISSALLSPRRWHYINETVSAINSTFQPRFYIWSKPSPETEEDLPIWFEPQHTAVKMLSTWFRKKCHTLPNRWTHQNTIPLTCMMINV